MSTKRKPPVKAPTSQASHGHSDAPSPREPAMLTRANEISARLYELCGVHNDLAKHLYGADGGLHDLEHSPFEDLEKILADISTRLACSVGFARTILTRISD